MSAGVVLGDDRVGAGAGGRDVVDHVDRGIGGNGADVANASAIGSKDLQVWLDLAGGVGVAERHLEGITGGGGEGVDVEVAGAVDHAGLGLPAEDRPAVAVGIR